MNYSISNDKISIDNLNLVNQEKNSQISEKLDNNFQISKDGYQVTPVPLSHIRTFLEEKRASNPLQDKELYHFSYDTVRFEIPFSPVEQLEIQEKLKTSSYFGFFESPDKEYPITGDKYFFCTEEDMDNAKSYEATRKVCFRPTGLLMEFSAPKFSYGTNQIMQWGFEGFFNSFRNRFIQKLGIETPFIYKWLLKRIDLSYCFQLDNFQEVERVIQYASKIRFRNKLPRCYGYPVGNETVQWTAKNKTLKLYNKFLEIKKNREHHEINEEDIQDNILRFEEEWRSKYLLKKLNLKSVSELTFERFLYYMKDNYTFEGHMSETFSQFEEKVIFNSIDEIFDFIKLELPRRKKSCYFEFFTCLAVNGIDKCKSKYSNSGFYRYVKGFRDIGIDVFKFDDFIRNNQTSNYIPISQYFTREYLYY